MSICKGDNERKLKINGIFLSPRGHNSAENYSTGPKFKLNLHVFVTYLYSEFQFKMSICNGDNERKLKINGIFLSPRDITLPKIIWPDANWNSTCVFSWHIYIPNFNSKCQFVELSLRILVTNPCTKFHLKISMYEVDNERKLNPEWRKGVTLYSICPGHIYGGGIKTNLVEVIEILFPVKFHWTQIDSLRVEVKNVSANQRPGRPSCFSDQHKKHKLGRGHWDLFSCQVSLNSVQAKKTYVWFMWINFKPNWQLQNMSKLILQGL